MGNKTAITRGKRQLVVVVAIFLYVSMPRRSRSEDFFDFKMLYYQEDKGRVGVRSPAFLYQKEFSPTFGIRIDGIYNAISGATPTGAPPISETITRTITVSSPPSSSDDEYDDEDEEDEKDKAVARSPFPFKAGATPSSGSSGGSSRSTTEEVETGEYTIPVSDVEDERYGLNIELFKKVDRHALSFKASLSTESDYLSQGIAVSDGISFNSRNTIITLGLAYTHDLIDVFSTGATETKNTVDSFIGVSQLLDKKTRLAVNFTAGIVDGYMSDPYKVVELNGLLVPEFRPDEKDREILFISLVRYLELLNASVTVSYRLYTDSFDITGGTYTLNWLQKVGSHFTIGPRMRLYDQTKSSFYAVRFQGTPEFYSSDYRLSSLQSTSFGVEVACALSQRVSLNVAYDRYVQKGTDGETNQQVYPTANMITMGGRVWF